MLIIIVSNAIPYNYRVAIAFLVVLVDNALLIFLKVGTHKLLLAEPLKHVKNTTLIGFLHSALNLGVAHHLVALDVNLVHINFLVLVDNDINNHLVLLTKVILLPYLTSSLLKSLSSIIFLDNLLYATSNIRSDLASHEVAKSLADILLLTFLHSQIVDLRDARLLTQNKLKPCLVAIDFLHFNLNFRENCLMPKSLGSILNLITRNLYSLPYCESGVSNDDVVLVIFNTSYLDTGNLILSWRTIKHHLWVVDGIINSIGFLSDSP